ncbi:hypothetical protein N7541_003433 [Penicillium brevicompactum]|uniref:Uncharacterized protein n=1 Tax=Penicillium brevicompactum TaxID=5074 RepID=A0A9W9UZT9_PENBR|nr:hypothetical protein N7541_003433 [Penicillium brevicompactum]
MAGMINGSFAIFRKSDSRKPLHARWGDASISVPTDGSWSQYDNPHRPVTHESRYGPGYVPGISHRHHASHSSIEGDYDDAQSACSSSSDTSRRSSLSLENLRPARGSGCSSSNFNHSPADFAYKPVQQHYPSEVERNPKAPGNRFNYIPTSGCYLQENVRTPAPRGHSSSSHRNYQPSRDRNAELINDNRFNRDSRPTVRVHSYDDHHQKLRSSIVDGSEHSRRGGVLPSRRKTSPFASADRKRASSKPLTMAMVPDQNDLYD